MVAELGCRRVASSGSWHESGLDCKQDNLLCVLVCSSVSRNAGAATSAMDETETTRSTDIANRIGQLGTNRVSERVARVNLEQHVTVQRQRLTRKPSSQVQARSSRLLDDWEPVMLSYMDSWTRSERTP